MSNQTTAAQINTRLATEAELGEAFGHLGEAEVFSMVREGIVVAQREDIPEECWNSKNGSPDFTVGTGLEFFASNGDLFFARKVPVGTEWGAHLGYQ